MVGGVVGFEIVREGGKTSEDCLKRLRLGKGKGLIVSLRKDGGLG